MLNFKLKTPTEQWFKDHNFRYHPIFSKFGEGNVYTYRFPVWKWQQFCTLEAEFMIWDSDGEVRVNVFDYNTRYRYAPWYQDKPMEYDNVCNMIGKRIKKEAQDLGLIEVIV